MVRRVRVSPSPSRTTNFPLVNPVNAASRPGRHAAQCIAPGFLGSSRSTPHSPTAGPTARPGRRASQT
eukprot:902816-Pyramimonas_sp.AAC.2